MAKLLSHYIHLSQVTVEEFEKRAMKGLRLQASETVTQVNKTEIFELYVIREELDVNPSAGNAQKLRRQAEKDGLSEITFPKYTDYASETDWLQAVYANVTAVNRTVQVCLQDDCEPIFENLIEGKLEASLAILGYKVSNYPVQSFIDILLPVCSSSASFTYVDLDRIAHATL